MVIFVITLRRITLPISLCTNMEKYAKYSSCNDTEKYANAIRVSYPDRIYREIREHSSRISLAQNIWRNTRIVLENFKHMEYLEKYANCVGVFHSQGTYREICEHNSRISLAQNI